MLTVDGGTSPLVQTSTSSFATPSVGGSTFPSSGLNPNQPVNPDPVGIGSREPVPAASGGGGGKDGGGDTTINIFGGGGSTSNNNPTVPPVAAARSVLGDAIGSLGSLFSMFGSSAPQTQTPGTVAVPVQNDTGTSGASIPWMPLLLVAVVGGLGFLAYKKGWFKKLTGGAKAAASE